MRAGPGILEDLAQGLDLHTIPNYGSRSMSFDEFHRIRRDTSFCVCSLKRPDLTFPARCGQASILSIARGPDTFDEGIDAVSIPFGIGQTLKHNSGNSLTQSNPISTFIEGMATSAG